MGQQRRYAPRACSICKQKGHRAPFCPSREGNVTPPPGEPAPPRGGAHKPHKGPVELAPAEMRHGYAITPLTLPDVFKLIDVPSALNPRRRASENTTPSQRWDLNTPYAAACDALRGGGIPEHTASVLRQTDPLDVAGGASMGWGMEFDVAGAEPDVARYLEGEPENMLEFSAPSPRPRVHIVFLFGVSCHTPASEMRERGAAIISAIDAAEARGVRVKLSVASFRNESMGGYILSLKEADQPLDLDLLAFILAHPAADRRVGFRLMEHTMPGLPAHYGIPTGEPTASKVFPEADVIVPPGKFDPSKAIAAAADRALARAAGGAA
jgi:hypothetical protein